MNDAERQAVRDEVRRALAGQGAVFGQGAPTPPVVATETVPGLVRIESADPSPAALIASSVRRLMLDADVDCSGNVAVPLGVPIALVAGERWWVEWHLWIDRGVAAAGDSLVVSATYPLVTKVVWRGLARQNQAGVTTLTELVRTLANSAGTSGWGSGTWFQSPGGTGTLQLHAGILDVQASGNLDVALACASAAGDCTVKAGSYVQAIRVPA